MNSNYMMMANQLLNAGYQAKPMAPVGQGMQMGMGAPPPQRFSLEDMGLPMPQQGMPQPPQMNMGGMQSMGQNFGSMGPSRRPMFNGFRGGNFRR